MALQQKPLFLTTMGGGFSDGSLESVEKGPKVGRHNCGYPDGLLTCCRGSLETFVLYSSFKRKALRKAFFSCKIVVLSSGFLCELKKRISLFSYFN